jgi:predicted acylesterase/phospholipase RssA/CRP-like cAMP-binding protein
VQKRITRNYDVSPGDALAEYPTSDDPATTAATTETSIGQSPLPSQANSNNMSAPVILEPSVAADRAIHSRHITGNSSDSGSDSSRGAMSTLEHRPPEGLPYSHARGVKNVTRGFSNARIREMERFMNMMRTTIQGLDGSAVLNIYEKLERLTIPAGQVLFWKGDDAKDGMYIVVKGELGLFLPDETSLSTLDPSHGSQSTPRTGIKSDDDSATSLNARIYSVHGSQASSFREAQTVGENSMIASTVFSRTHRTPDSSQLPVLVDALRPATCVAVQETTVLRLDGTLFDWFAESFPHAVVNFVLTTTTRQWRVGHFLLIDFLHLKDAWLASMEPPGHAPPFSFDAKKVSRSSNKSDPLPSPSSDVAFDTISFDAKQLRYPPPSMLSASLVRSSCSAVLLKEPGDIVFSEGMEADSLFIVLSGHGVCYLSEVPSLSGALYHSIEGEDVVYVAYDQIPLDPAVYGAGFVPGGCVASRRLSPGCIGGGTACLVGIPHRETLVAVTPMEIAVFPRRLFTMFADSGPSAGATHRAVILREISLAVGRSMVPLLRMLLALGVQRTWLTSGQTLFHQGQNAEDGMYVVISGRLRTYVPDQPASARQTIAERAGVLADGRLPSEIQPLLEGDQTAVPSVAEGANELDSSDTDSSGGDIPSVRSPLASLSPPHSPLLAPRPSNRSDMSASSRGQSKYREAAAKRRAVRTSERSFPTGSHFTSGSPAYKVDIGRGETVGELSVLIRERKRTISAVCIRDCELVRISQRSFELISQRYPAVMTHFTRVLANRYSELTHKVSGGAQPGAFHQPRATGNAPNGNLFRQLSGPHAAKSNVPIEDAGQLAEFVHGVSTSAIATSPTASTLITIAVVGAGGIPASVADFSNKLVQSLERSGEGAVLHLTSSKLDLILGEGTAVKLDELFVRAKVGAWLSAQEEKYRFLVFEADPSPADSLFHQSPVPRISSWRSQQQATYVDMARNVLTSVSGAGAGLKASMRHVGKKLDSAVKAGIGVSPSAVLLSALGAQGNSKQDYGGQLLPPSSVSPQAAMRSSPWTKVCVQQADLCLLVGQAHTAPELSLAELECVYQVIAGDQSRSNAPGISTSRGSSTGLNDDTHNTDSAAGLVSRSFCAKELVLLHPDPTRRPAGTRTWLRNRRVSWHHHVRTWYEEDYDRIARHVCGKARGVVLGGGGSRGLAHLGVLQVLEERNIGIDVIGGTSQGAFMAACYALTLDTNACVPLVKRLANAIGNTWSLVTSLTLPIFSYFSGTSFNDALIDNFKDTQIEDLWIKYFCVSTDVTNDTTVVHQTGPLWRFCRASMTVVGLLPPLWDRGRLLVDGGYTNNLPVEVLRSLSPQVNQVVCVDVENKDNRLFEGIDNYGDSLSGWFIAWKWCLSMLRLSPSLRIPPLSEVALKISYISHGMMIRNLLKHADDSIIYIRPDVGTKYKLLDYHLMTNIVQTGMDAAVETLDKWEHRQHRRLLKLLHRAAKLHLKALHHAPSVVSSHSASAQFIMSPPASNRARFRPAVLPPHPEVDDTSALTSDSPPVPASGQPATPFGHANRSAGLIAPHELVMPTQSATPTRLFILNPPGASSPSISKRSSQDATFTIGPDDS